MMLVLGALMLLSMLSLSVNSMFIDKTTTMLDAEASLDAISIAQSMIDEIQVKSFDAATVTNKIYNASDLTSASGMGPNSSESSLVPLPDTTSPFRSVQYYSDVDDYNLYRRVVTNPRLGKFTVVDSVFYVSETVPDQRVGTQTFLKKIVVTVTHKNMRRPLQISDIAVYRRYF
jgi:hypothetical protein